MVEKNDIIKIYNKKEECITFFFNRAGDGNRTHVISLEGWSSTIELHPHILFAVLCFPQRQVILYPTFYKLQVFF